MLAVSLLCPLTLPGLRVAMHPLNHVYMRAYALDRDESFNPSDLFGLTLTHFECLAALQPAHPNAQACPSAV